MAKDESNSEELTEKERNDQNNKKNVQNAADAAIASKEPHAVAIGSAVKAADKLTGGKSSELIGKGLTNANKFAPGGKMMQNASNNMAESGMSDNIGKAAAMKNGMPGKEGANTPNQVQTKSNKGGEQDGSLPSSDGSKNNDLKNRNDDRNNNNDSKNKSGKDDSSSFLGKRKKDSGGKDSSGDASNFDDIEEAERQKAQMFKTAMKFILLNPVTQVILGFFAMVFLFLLFVVAIIGVVTNIFGSHEDAIGISEVLGQENGNAEFVPSSPEQEAFFERIKSIISSYQADGKTVDALKIVAVYNVLNNHEAGLEYDDMTDSAIREIVDAMFSDNYYSEEVFKNNLINNIFKKYLPDSSDHEREVMAREVFEYIEDYYDLIGKKASTCASGGTCTYNIKGFYIQGRGNISKSLNIDNLYVRLMQCGNAGYRDYGGTFGKALEGEELVPFEQYVLGAAYAEIGDTTEQAFKAQLIVARSFVLARHVEMGGWHTLQQESDGKWVLQVSNSTCDQLYCNPDEGCSWDAKKSHLYSGTNGAGGVYKKALAPDSKYRQYAQDTIGEVLVNSQGYILYTGFKAAESRQFNSLDKAGYNYKQILLQVYNQGSRSYGAANIDKASCGGSSGNCVSNGSYASWKQYEGEWIDVPIGNSGKNIRQIGCLVTSLSIQVAKSGVPTNISNLNPGTFVQALNNVNAFDSGGSLMSYASVESIAPTFKYKGYLELSGMGKQEKLNAISSLVNQPGIYAVAEVKGNTGQHWVAIDSVNGSTINMMDPGSASTDMWSQYNWANTSRIVYYKVG